MLAALKCVLGNARRCLVLPYLTLLHHPLRYSMQIWIEHGNTMLTFATWRPEAFVLTNLELNLTRRLVILTRNATFLKTTHAPHSGLSIPP
jgi:hypothetical protein